MATWYNLNGELHEGNRLQIAIDNRAFHYGDGFFESLRFDGGSCRLWQYHEERIHKTSHALKMVLNKGFTKSLRQQIDRLLDQMSLDTTGARVRIQLFRSGGGKYGPAQDQADFLIEAEPLTASPKDGARVTFCTEPIVGSASFRGAKTLNALPYVLAAIEKREKKVDEILLHDTHGNLIEASASNLWWVEGEAIYTPPLTSGCVEGVFRKHLLQEVPKQGIEVAETAVDRVRLLAAKEVFLTNAVQGVQWVDEIDGVFFGSQVSHYLIENLGF